MVDKIRLMLFLGISIVTGKFCQDGVVSKTFFNEFICLYSIWKSHGQSSLGGSNWTGLSSDVLVMSEYNI